MAAGASVTRVAQAQGVHVTQIHDWRKEYRTGNKRAKSGRGVNLLPALLGIFLPSLLSHHEIIEMR
jgi:transposase-like protein